MDCDNAPLDDEDMDQLADELAGALTDDPTGVFVCARARRSGE